MFDRIFKLIRLFADAFKLLNPKYKLIIVSDGAGWVIDDISYSLKRSLPQCKVAVVNKIHPILCKNKTIHFIARFAVFDEERLKRLARSNKIIATWWHGGACKIKGNKEFERLNNYLKDFVRLAFYIDKIHISSSIYKKVLIEAGVAAEKIVCLPLGIDLERWNNNTIGNIRKKLSISPNIFCIGSFQRDGGEEPKLVKGPDVLIKSVDKIYRKNKNLMVLLSGPNRNYVIGQFERLGVPYKYVGVLGLEDMSALYKALDLYIVSSREEGGPASVLESLASGVPLVSTKVGIAVDIIQNRHNGILANIGDAEEIAKSAFEIWEDNALRQRLIKNGLETIKKYDWKIIAKQYEERLY